MPESTDTESTDTTEENKIICSNCGAINTFVQIVKIVYTLANGKELEDSPMNLVICEVCSHVGSIKPLIY